jgi:hypothetical protein
MHDRLPNKAIASEGTNTCSGAEPGNFLREGKDVPNGAKIFAKWGKSQFSHTYYKNTKN